MKDLDREIKYNLNNANNEQLTEVLEWLKQKDKNCTRLIGKGMLYYLEDGWYRANVSLGDCCITTLFEPQLKIGDTFEKDGFVCEVKEKIGYKKWYLLKSPDNKTISYEKLGREDLKDINHLYTKQEIYNKEFIKQLEENAR